MIANWGEIAVRIARGCRDVGLASVTANGDAVPVRAADDAAPLHGATPAAAYLDIGKVLQATVGRGADALPLVQAVHRAIRMRHLFQLRVTAARIETPITG